MIFTKMVFCLGFSQVVVSRSVCMLNVTKPCEDSKHIRKVHVGVHKSWRGKCPLTVFVIVIYKRASIGDAYFLYSLAEEIFPDYIVFE